MKIKKIILVLVLGFIINSLNAQEVKTYYLNGQLESIGTKTNGKRSGHWKFYYGENNGYAIVEDKTKTGPLIKEAAYVDGKKTGEWKEYYDNGKIKSILHYKSDKLFGNFSQYNEQGELICQFEDYNENNLDIYVSTYKFNSVIPATLKVIKSSENKLLIEGLKDFLGDSFTNKEELIEVSKHKYKIELENSDKIFFEFKPFNSEVILIIDTEKVEMTMTFRKIIK